MARSSSPDLEANEIAPHTEEQAEGSEEEVDTSGAEQARDED